uniref:Uncharacterized protein n=1 Tax=Ciona intestinalis TaxID=7719 RepID=H2XQL1_CIOIN
SKNNFNQLTCSLAARVARVSPTTGNPDFAPASLQFRCGLPNIGGIPGTAVNALRARAYVCKNSC